MKAEMNLDVPAKYDVTTEQFNLIRRCVEHRKLPPAACPLDVRRQAWQLENAALRLGGMSSVRMALQSHEAEQQAAEQRAKRNCDRPALDTEGTYYWQVCAPHVQSNTDTHCPQTVGPLESWKRADEDAAAKRFLQEGYTLISHVTVGDNLLYYFRKEQ